MSETTIVLLQASICDSPMNSIAISP